MIVLAVIFFLILLILFFPVVIDINTNIFYQDLKINKISNMDNRCKIKFLHIPIYTIEPFVKTSKNKSKKKKIGNRVNVIEFVRILIEKAEISQFNLNLGFNLHNSIANSYVVAALNTLLCLFINSYSDIFNFKRLYYQTYISSKPLNLNLKCIIKLNLANTIIALLKSKNTYKKEENEKEKNYYGTSN